MKSFQILDSEITFSTERVNYFMATMMYRDMALKARQQLEQEYSALGNMKRVMENLDETAFKIYQDVIQKSLEYIQQQNIYAIDFEGLLEQCFRGFQKYFIDAFEAVSEQYEEIIYEQKEAVEYRQRRKANRGKYSGWGYGIGGAISASAKAGALNMATGIGHSLVNGVGNAGSSAVSAVKQSSLYNNAETKERLFEGIYDASYMVCYKVMDIISRHSNIRFESISKDKVSEARALSNNILANGIPEQHIRDAIIRSLLINPENKDLMQYVITNYGDTNKNIEQMGEFFGYDLKPVKQEAVCKMFGRIEEKRYETEAQLLAEKEAVIQKCAELGLDTAYYTEFFDAKWLEIDKALRTVEGTEYQTRDIARNVEKDIEIFEKKCMEFQWDDMNLLDENCRYSCEMEVKGADYLEDVFVAQIRERLEGIWEPYIYRQNIIYRLSNPDTFLECFKEIVAKEPVYEALRKKIYFYDCAEKIKEKVPISTEETGSILFCIDRTMFGVGKKGIIFTSRKIIEYDKQKISWAYLKEIAGIRPENDAFFVVDTRGDVILTISSPGNLSDENRKGFAAWMYAIAVGISRTDIEALEEKLSGMSIAQQTERKEKNKFVHYFYSDKVFSWKVVKDGFHSFFNRENADMARGDSTTEKNRDMDNRVMNFCSNCGSQLIEGALFCQECGTKLMVDDAGSITAENSVQVDMQEPVESMASEVSKVVKKGNTEISKPDKLTVSEVQKFAELTGQTVSETPNTFAPTSARKAYDLLRENAPHCSEIKKVLFREKQGITTVKGKINQYAVWFLQGNYKLTANPAFPFNIPIMILGFAISHTAFIFSWNSADGYGTDFDEIYLILGLGLFLGGLSGAIISALLGNREKKKVMSFIGEVLSKESGTKRPMTFAIEPIVYSAVALAGIVALTVGSGVLDNIGISGYDESSHGAYNDKLEAETYIPPSDVENVLLSNIYTNEEEGFSFMYPYNWDIEDVEEVNPDALVSVACTGVFGTYARITVGKVVDDGLLFVTKKADFEEEYSSEPGVSNVKVMDLSDMVLDGYPARKLTVAANNDIGVQYFYVRDYYIYIVTCVVEENNYDSYEPIFDAIMDSYTITATGCTSATNVGPVGSIEEAQGMIEDWMVNHPLGDMAGVLGTSDDGTDSSGNAAYVFELWIAPREFAGSVYVRKSDGYMTFQQFDFSEGISLDDWYREWSGGGNTSSDLRYMGVSLIDMLDCVPVQLYDTFGSPTFGTPVDGDMYIGGEYYGYDGIMFVIDYSTTTVSWITGAADVVEINGYTLDKTRAGIVEILGEPSYEEDYCDETGDFRDCHYMLYVDESAGIVLSIEFPDSNSEADAFEFYRYEEDF